MDLGADLPAAFVLWERGVITSEELVDTATAALVEGLDSPSLRELAGVSVADAPYSAPQLATRALEELGMKPADEHTARRLLATRVARRIVSGDDDAFRGASRLWRIFMDSPRYPEFAGHFIGLEDEWEGRWGRSEADLRAEVRSTAADILDAWGDSLSPVHRLHSATRRWLHLEFEHWAQAYSQIQREGRWQVPANSSIGWTYSAEALATFPRYRAADAMLAEIERLRPSRLRTTDSYFVAAYEAVRAAGQNPIAQEPSAEEEIAAFNTWLATVDLSSLPGDLLPYRRTIAADEIDDRRRKMQGIWGVTDSWVPMTDQPVPDGTVILDSRIWNEPRAVNALRTALLETGDTVMVSINETDRSFEVATQAFDPSYAGYGEVLATPLYPSLLIYTSHEGTCAISKGPHLDELRRLMPDLAGWEWKGWTFQTKA